MKFNKINLEHITLAIRDFNEKGLDLIFEPHLVQSTLSLLGAQVQYDHRTGKNFHKLI